MHPVMRERARSTEGGFTLIELLVVMIIIAILMAVAVPTFLKQKQNAVRSQATQNIGQIKNAIESCAVDNVDGSYTGCQDFATLAAMEPTLSNIVPAPTVAAAGALGYTITLRTNSGASFVLTSQNGQITKTCTPGSEGAGKACPTSGKW